MLRHLIICFIISTFLFASSNTFSYARQIDDAADLPEQQAQEKSELNDMRSELEDLKSTISGAQEQMQQLRNNMSHRKITEIHLITKETGWEIAPGISNTFLSYNGQIPGPTMRLKEGDLVKVVLHNQLKVPTSIYFHGLTLPHSVNGLPRKDQGIVLPGQTFAYQFIANQVGTFWYHPQINHLNQIKSGLYGAITIEPTRMPKTYERDFVYLIGQTTINKPTSNAPFSLFTVNGKSAPAIAAMELKRNERVRLRLINVSESICPLHISGHKFEIVSINGSDSLEPHVNRDTITLNPADRIDIEFVADNPGVWSFSSLLPAQTTNNGQFPGGIAVVIRYND
jgi:FtsP/CotA-like multicopper oxidase with cupredoxin domain